MELVTEKPFNMLLDTVGKATIEKMRIRPAGAGSVEA